MATKKMPISKFVEELKKARDRKDGYIMGAKGQNPKKWAKNSWWYEQYEGNAQRHNKALYWRDHAERVWDCNGLAEGIYQDFSGVNINTKARFNYSQWCDPKGTSKIPVKYRVPGAAVFIHDSDEGYITHVGYLIEPVNKSNPAGDWYIIEAKGVMYGVVQTLYNSRGWNRWGWMTKYFDYGNAEQNEAIVLGDRTLRDGDEGEDVKALQTNLIRLGYDCGKWGADGDFGDATEIAVEKFQKDHGLTVDGIYGPKSHDAMEKAMAELDKPVEKPTKVKIVGGDCWIRTKPDKNDPKTRLLVAHEGDTYEFTNQISENGWHSIKCSKGAGWVSGKYSEVVK